MKHLAVLGSTGSIGTQSLEVVDHLADWQVDLLSAHRNRKLVYEQIKKYHPAHVFITDKESYLYFKDLAVEFTGTAFHYGWQDYPSCLEGLDCVIGAISGAAGIEPTLLSLQAGLRVGLANKETMVEAGDLVLDTMERCGGTIIPVDSEHSAIFQCLERDGLMGAPASAGRSCASDAVAKIILTASGGPFRTLEKEAFTQVTRERALAHPNWSMGAKVTIDSATMMNKGLEVLEAHYLFNCDYDRIQVVVHPESIVHSMVQYVDGAVKAQLGLADMRLPIQLALTWPERAETAFPVLDVWDMGTLRFEKPRFDVFPGIQLAYECGRKAGTAPVVMNAANEVAVAAFLADQIRFTDIIPTVTECVERTPWQAVESLAHIHEADAQARDLTKSLLRSR
jgi:1-deoxy-D-xylulose-5-phosphate reductoisomerase